MPDQARHQDPPAPPANGSDQPPLLEWITGFIGAVLVAATLGFLVYRAITSDGQPPVMEFTPLSITEAGDGYLVIFSVRNVGGETAASLVVEGALHAGGDPIEARTATLSYVPPGAQRQGGFYFSHDPDDYALRFRALSYDTP